MHSRLARRLRNGNIRASAAQLREQIGFFHGSPAQALIALTLQNVPKTDPWRIVE
jgi:hypothetical protein